MTKNLDSRHAANPDLPSRLQARQLTAAYGPRTICQQLDVAIPDGSFSVIVGPNGCGKSTLLRSLCRLLPPRAGEIMLDGRDLHAYRPRELATRLGLLPQSAIAPDGITVYDLVARGRYPHQRLLQPWRASDEAAVQAAMSATSTQALAESLLEELSGGQRQRVWVAMALAQQTDILLLDEPTTFLDIAHQIELLELFSQLQRAGRTLVAVLHDINHACRYASHLIAMKDGNIVAQGKPADIVTPALMAEVFGLDCLIIDDPVSHTPLIVPRGRKSA